MMSAVVVRASLDAMLSEGASGLMVEARTILHGRVHLDLLEDVRGAGLLFRSVGIAHPSEKPRCQLRRPPSGGLASLRKGRVGQSR